MQMVWVGVAGAVLAWLYVAAFDAVLCSRHASRMSLLLAIVGFVEGTGIVLAFIWVLSDGSFERLIAALGGFVGARALLGDHVLEPWDGEERVAAGENATLAQQPLDRLA
ncbi:MAG TPA: hypothetical protein VGK50_02985 [Coriobacteriia bacterium]|jgi:hypothetical protein